MVANKEKLGKNFREISLALKNDLTSNSKVHCFDDEYDSGSVSYEFSNEEYVEIDNKYMEFKIKELKGWLFGFWLDYDQEKDSDGNYYDIYTYKCFCKVEKFINKYNPSNSMFVCEGKIQQEEFDFILESSMIQTLMFSEIGNMIKYIKKNRNIAWCRDVLWIDYNETYLTKLGAFNLRLKNEFKHKFEQVVGKLVVKKKLKLVKKYILKDFEGSYIYDRGKECIPRYEIAIPLSIAKRTLGIEKCGAYGIGFEEDDDEYLIKVGKLENLEYKLIGLTLNTNVVEDEFFVVIDDMKENE